MDTVERVRMKLMSIPGVVACWVLPHEERELVRRLEAQSNLRQELPGMVVANEGIKDILNCKHVIAISHSPALRHPPGPVLVISNEEIIVGEEVWELSKLEKLSTDPNAILVGKGLVVYRDALIRTKGKPLKLAYRALRFPELEGLAGVQDVISVTVGILVHFHLGQRAGWNINDPNLGTVLIGFNESIRGEHPSS